MKSIKHDIALLLLLLPGRHRHQHQYADMKQKYTANNIGFEPLILETIGGVIGETARLLQLLCCIVDLLEGCPIDLHGKISRFGFLLICIEHSMVPVRNNGPGNYRIMISGRVPNPRNF